LGVFECRGIELTGFEPGNSLSVVIQSGKTFENIDVRYRLPLRSDLWAEYDEISQTNATIDELRFEIVKSRFS